MAVELLLDAPSHLPAEPGPFRVEDYLQLPDEPRCELLRGLLVVTPAPRFGHQLAQGVLYDVLLRYARSIGGRAVTSPIDVELADDTVVQPDLLLLTPGRLDRIVGHVRGAPDLLVEIVSPGSARRDRVLKLELYRETDLREYWIVDPTERTVDFLTLRGGTFEMVPVAGERYRSPNFEGLELDLVALWRELDDPRAVPRAP
jgi:Uma2 family endonuclease